MKTITDITYLTFALIAFVCFALSPQVRATCQEGCLTNQNTVLGDNALLNTTGINNTAIGFYTLNFNTTGNDNTAVGSSVLVSNTTGGENTGVGFGVLKANTIGSNNTAVGASALLNNISANSNTAVGFGALNLNTIGSNNTAVGANALLNSISANSNTAIGSSALYFNSMGNSNTAVGSNVLIANTTGSGNTAVGTSALLANSTGSTNTAVGLNALFINSSGSSNAAMGHRALFQCRGSSNIALGVSAGYNITSGNNNIDIGNTAVNGDSGIIRIGNTTHTNTYITGIYGVTLPAGGLVYIDSTGHLGTKGSSARFKEAIKPMDKASESILALKPVTFRYKHELDPKGIPQFGLVAEDVEKINPDLVARDDHGKPFTVRYEAVNAMLLNEFLKEHRTVQEQQEDIDALRSELREQRALIQKVSARVELQTAPAQTVANSTGPSQLSPTLR
jgi:hypothetical protein